jgi:GMP synthase (glutamine-hydrolysing)
MPSPPTCLVWQHVPHEGPGVFGDLLAARGWQVTSAMVIAPEDVTPQAEQADLLLVLGGPMGVHQADRHPALRAEIDRCARRLAADRPTLGVCLGAQIMAAALGAAVQPMDRREIGWFPLEPEPWALEDREAWGLTARTRTVLHWHEDTFDLPDGARRLAGSAATPNQGFRWGRNGYALQFHLEVPAAEIRLWTSGHRKGADEGDSVQTAAEIVDGAQRHGPDTAGSAGIFLHAWLSRLEAERGG